MRHHVLLAAACVVALVLPLTPAAAFNGNDVAKTTDAASRSIVARSIAGSTKNSPAMRWNGKSRRRPKPARQ